MIDNASDAPTAVVAIVSFRRPERLAALLSALPERMREAGDLARVSVLVVDNDPAGSAGDPVRKAGLPNLRYVLEPTPGIAAARSRALEESQAFDMLAFIDDDEIPQAGWLRLLLELQRETGAAAVTGRCITRFPDDVDPWVLAGGYFQRPSRPTGTLLPVAATNNLLLDLRQVRALGLTFDTTLGLAGGEDSAFTRELVHRGGIIVWCQESVVVDHIDPQRLTRPALLRRAFAQGNVDARIRLTEAAAAGSRPAETLRVLLRGSSRVMVGALRAAWGYAIRSNKHNARGQRMLRRGAGMVSFVCGKKFDEYQRT